jgi:hypothetical protein
VYLHSAPRRASLPSPYLSHIRDEVRNGGKGRFQSIIGMKQTRHSERSLRSEESLFLFARVPQVRFLNLGLGFTGALMPHTAPLRLGSCPTRC